MSSLNNQSFTSFSSWIPLISPLIAMIRTSKTMLNKSGENWYSCLFPNLRDNAQIFTIEYDFRCKFVISCYSVAQPCPTLCDPMDYSMPGFPVLHHLLEIAQTHIHWVGDTIQPSCPLLFPSPPAFNLSQHQGLLSLSHRAFIMLRLIPSVSTFWRVFIINGYWILSKVFSTSIEVIIQLLFFNTLIWCIMMMCRYWISVHPWDKFHLTMVYDPFNVLLDT